MAYEQKPNTGSLFKNDKKEKDTHADYRGSATIADREYYLDAWINEAKDGRKYMHVKFKPKEGAPARIAEKPGKDDSIPF